MAMPETKPCFIRSISTGARPTLITWPPMPHRIGLRAARARRIAAATERKSSAARIRGRESRNAAKLAPGFERLGELLDGYLVRAAGERIGFQLLEGERIDFVDAVGHGMGVLFAQCTLLGEGRRTQGRGERFECSISNHLLLGAGNGGFVWLGDAGLKPGATRRKAANTTDWREKSFRCPWHYFGMTAPALATLSPLPLVEAGEALWPFRVSAWASTWPV